MPETLSGAGDSLCERKGHSISTSIGGIATARVGGKFATGCQKLFWVQAITRVNGKATFSTTAASTSLSATTQVNGASFYQPNIKTNHSDGPGRGSLQPDAGNPFGGRR